MQMSDDGSSGFQPTPKERPLKVALSPKLALEAEFKPDIEFVGPDGPVAVEIKVKADGEHVGSVGLQKDTASKTNWIFTEYIESYKLLASSKPRKNADLANLFTSANWRDAAEKLRDEETDQEEGDASSGLLYYVQVGANVKSYLSALQGGGPYSVSLADLTADFLRGDYGAADRIRAIYKASRVKLATPHRHADLDDGPGKAVRAGVGAAKVRALAA